MAPRPQEKLRELGKASTGPRRRHVVTDQHLCEGWGVGELSQESQRK